ncbi:hypothetical protein [Neobacillus sp. 204]|uniref:hypothetical protein n=1 Tax=Neobacillus sp. 204 TaxID=3383351 RepID=UPI003979E84E
MDSWKGTVTCLFVQLSFSHAGEGNLNEQAGAPLKVENSHFSVVLKQNQVKTVLF